MRQRRADRARAARGRAPGSPRCRPSRWTGQIPAATANYRAYLDAEIERLRALKALNPALREEEITRLETRLERGVDALAQARATLQGVRLVLTR